MRLVTSRPSFLGVLPQKKNYRKALAFSESPKRAESVWVATLMVSSSAQGEAVAGCNRTTELPKKMGSFPTNFCDILEPHISTFRRCLWRPPGPRAVRTFFPRRDETMETERKDPLSRIPIILRNGASWLNVTVFPAIFFISNSGKKLLAPKNLKASKTKHKRASRLIPGVRSLVMKLSLFHSSTTVARGTAQIITGIPDSHQGCFVITPLIRLPN